jgi:hypothetical protein
MVNDWLQLRVVPRDSVKRESARTHDVRTTFRQTSPPVQGCEQADVKNSPPKPYMPNAGANQIRLQV